MWGILKGFPLLTPLLQLTCASLKGLGMSRRSIVPPAVLLRVESNEKAVRDGPSLVLKINWFPVPLTAPSTMFVHLVEGGFLLHARAEARNVSPSATTITVK